MKRSGIYAVIFGRLPISVVLASALSIAANAEPLDFFSSTAEPLSTNRSAELLVTGFHELSSSSFNEAIGKSPSPAGLESCATGFRRRRVAELNAGTLAALESIKADDPLAVRFRLFPGAEPICLFHRKESVGSGSVYSGEVQDAPGSQVLLSVQGSALTGQITIPGAGSFQIDRAGGALCTISELDPSSIRRCGSCAEALELPAVTSSEKPQSRPVGLLDLPEPGALAPIHTVKLMVVYTPDAKAGAGGDDEIRATINLAVAQANLVFANSETNVRIELVHAGEIAYAESGNMNVELDRLRATEDGFMDEAHAWRDQFQADLVSLWTENGSDYAGVATTAIESTGGFSVIARSQATRWYQFVHELGHNFGCDHDRRNAWGAGRFSYSFGYRFELNGVTYRTVMCYFPGEVLPYFSNPRLTFLGVPLGLPAGQPNEADNAQTIVQSAAEVSAYRGLEAKLIAPKNGDSFEEGTVIELQAEVTRDEPGPLKVNFLDNKSFVGQAVEPPYAVLWTAPAGNHQLSITVELEGLPSRSFDGPTVAVRLHNRTFANRLTLTGSNVIATANLFAAIPEPSNPAPFGAPAATAWWSWTAPFSGTAMVVADGSTVGRARVAVYEGESLDCLLLLAKSDWPVGGAEFEIVAGHTYQIMVDGERVDRSAPLRIKAYQRPVNDNFGAATRIPSNLTTLQVITAGATREIEEPAIGPNARGHSVWFNWSPPLTGRVQLTSLGLVTFIDGDSSGPGLVSSSPGLFEFAVFTGTELTTLQRVATTAQARDGFDVVRGTTYFFAVDGTYGEARLSLRMTPAPVNDSFKQRSSLSGTAIHLSVQNFAATREPGEPIHGKAPGGRSVWWTWRPPKDGALILLRNTFFPGIDDSSDLNVAIYTGSSLTNLAPIAAQVLAGNYLIGANDRISFDNGWPPISRGETISLDVSARTNYIIAVDSKEAVYPGTSLQLQFEPPPANDSFTNRIFLADYPLPVTASTLGATAETDEPSVANSPPRHSLWWSWTAPTNGLAVVSLGSSSGTPPGFAIYTGDDLPGLSFIAANENADARWSSVTFQAAAGKAYHLRVDEAESSSHVWFALNYSSKPLNDDFDSWIALTNFNFWTPGQGGSQLRASTAGATVELGEPEHARGAAHSVWYSWKAPFSWHVGLLAWARDESPYGSAGLPPNVPDPWIDIYTGRTISTLRKVVSGRGFVLLNTETDAIYQIAITAEGEGPFALTLTSTLSLNDAFQPDGVNFVTVPQSIEVTSLDFRLATREPAEPSHGGRETGHSLWWTFLAPSSGWYSVRKFATVNPSFPLRDFTMAVYTGPTVSNLVLVSRQDGKTVRFPAAANVRYHIAADQAEPDLRVGPDVITRYYLNIAKEPSLEIPSLSEPNWFRFRIKGYRGDSFIWEISEDILNWRPMTQISLSGSEFIFMEPRFGVSKRFYRIRPVP